MLNISPELFYECENNLMKKVILLLMPLMLAPEAMAERHSNNLALEGSL